MSTIWLLILTLCVFLHKNYAAGPQDPGLIEKIRPNFDKVDGLICYQCKSLSSELQPLCDKSMFKLATEEEKYNMSLQCPHYQGAYCFIKVTAHKKKVTETIRGCTGPEDKNGNSMKVGCMKTKNGSLCLCDSKFCNKGDSLISHVIVIGIVTAIGFLVS